MPRLWPPSAAGQDGARYRQRYQLGTAGAHPVLPARQLLDAVKPCA
jgi:hypothetical protein